MMSNRREHRGSKSSLIDSFDAIEEGGIRASSSYSSDISDHDNDKAMDTLKDRVTFLKRLTGDIHDEVLNHNRLLDRTGNDMDASRGILSGTVNRFKMVFESRSGRQTCRFVGYFVLLFLVLYFLYSRSSDLRLGDACVTICAMVDEKAVGEGGLAKVVQSTPLSPSSPFDEEIFTPVRKSCWTRTHSGSKRRSPLSGCNWRPRCIGKEVGLQSSKPASVRRSTMYFPCFQAWHPLFQLMLSLRVVYRSIRAVIVL